MKGLSLGLKTLSISEVAGTSLTAKGSVADVQNLTGVDAKLSGKISDMEAFKRFAKLDANALPPYIKSLEFDVQAKGNVKGVSNIGVTAKALNGSLTAKGDVQNLMSKPNFDQLALSVRHPNFLTLLKTCLLYTSPSPRDLSTSRMPSSA